MRISITFLILFLSLSVFAQNTSKTTLTTCSKKTDALWALLQKKHVAPIQFNKEVAQQIIELLLNDLDYRKIHFYETDKQNLLIQVQNISPKSADDLCKLVSTISDLYQTRIKESQTILNALTTKELDFKENEIITFSTAEQPFMESKEKKVNRWKRYIKMILLNEAYYAIDSIHINDATAPKNFMSNNTDIKNSIINKELKKIEALLNPSKTFLATIEDALLNAICKRYDPHTEYYDYATFKNFSEQLQSQVLTFGVFFGETDYGNLSISYVAPGSIAWFSNSVQEGDLVLSFKLNQQAFDPIALTYSEANELLQNSKYTILDLEIKKENGSIEKVKLKKEAIKFEDNTVKSYIIQDDKKIGYISIPSFYTDSNNPNALGVANELSKEILKLKNEGIQGLIIDLRYNGGGSLYEAVSMSSLFIDIGPLFYTLDNSGKAILTKDMNRGTVYNGPLCIMVNGHSASASEIFSAAMQDNHRAIIVGEQTYGKSTGQNMVPLDSTIAIDKLTSDDNIGVVKFTEIKIYRTTGVSYQGKGVRPDITLPYLNILDQRENKEPYYLIGDSIPKKAVFPFPPALPIKILNEKYTARIKETPRYKLLTQMSDSLHRTENEDFVLHLSAAEFWKDMKLFKSHSLKESAAASYIKPAFQVYYNQLESDFLNYDANYKKLYTGYLDELKTDLTLQLTHDIMCDFINIK
ncbi:S41 family peptidase [uncultured Cytophaga sp.]|uniref:S41 family peptidase n=1 Tax=uncultured Cytophaga sp. TaxID=160238 RepID=UPI00260376DF|nr:S41 family peptidase [uncultured Cytophaga sp.]